MPLPKPKPRETYKKFASRFLKDKEAKKEYPEIRKRFAVMASTWGNSKNKPLSQSEMIKKHNTKVRRQRKKLKGDFY